MISAGFRLHAGYMRMCRLVEFDPRTIAAQLPKAPFVLVANHPTLIDVVLLLSCSPSICCVAKGVLFRSPLVGRLLRASNHIDTGDGSVFTAGQVIQTGLERLRDGDSVLIFPEGTRSPADGLGSFKPGAFVMAARAQVPLVLVRITCSPPGLDEGDGMVYGPRRYDEVHDDRSARTGHLRIRENGRALAAHVRAVFERSLAPDPAVSVFNRGRSRRIDR